MEMSFVFTVIAMVSRVNRVRVGMPVPERMGRMGAGTRTAYTAFVKIILGVPQT